MTRVTYTHDETVAEESVRVFRTDTCVRIPMGSFEDGYRRHVQALFRLALSVVGRRELAEDLTADGFVAQLRRDRSGEANGLVKGYLQYALALLRNTYGRTIVA